MGCSSCGGGSKFGTRASTPQVSPQGQKISVAPPAPNGIPLKPLAGVNPPVNAGEIKR